MNELYDLFSNIIRVNENPTIFITSQVAKVDGKVKTTQTKEVIELISYDNLLDSIFLRIKNESKKVEIEYLVKNIFQKIFNTKSKNIKQIQLKKNSILIINSKLSSKINHSNFIINDNLKNEIIVFTKDNLILSDKNEYYFNIKNFILYKLI